MRDRNVFFSFISLSVYFLCQMLIWPGSEFIRWPTRLSHAGVYVLRLAFNLMSIKFLYNKSFDEKDTFQCHLLQSLRIISYSVPFLNSKWKNRVLPQNNSVKGQLLPVIQNFLAPSKKKKKINGIFYLLELMNLLKNLCPAIFDSFEGNFIHALCRRTEILHSLPRVDKRVLLRNRLARCRDGYVDLRRCFGLE